MTWPRARALSLTVLMALAPAMLLLTSVAAQDVPARPPTQLEELVTTVPGEHRVRELGHVVGRINADSLVKEAPVSNMTELLAARVPGLLVQPRQGIVGGEVRLQIRTPTSVALSTEPLVIVDGARYTINPRAGPAARTGYPIDEFDSEGTSRLNDLSPNDVASIEVVKGPSAVTLHGTDAANGVILITTKRGRVGSPRWNAYGRASLSEIPTYRYADGYWGWGSLFASCALADAAQGLCAQDSVTTFANPLNDRARTIFSSKPRWRGGANVAGGNPSLRYYLSADLEDATGAVRLPPGPAAELAGRRGVRELPEELREANAFDRITLYSTASASPNEVADLRVTAGYTQSDTRTLIADNPYRGAGLGTPADPFLAGWSPEEAFAQTSTERIDRLVGSAAFEWRMLPWLHARGVAGLDLTNSNRTGLARPGEAPNAGYLEGAVEDARTRYHTTTVDLGATARAAAGRFSSRTAAGAQYVRTLFDGLSSRGYGLPPGGSSITEAVTRLTAQDYHERIIVGGYLEQTVGMDDRRFLTAGLRVDGASGFGPRYDAVVYPKVGASWLVSEEAFLRRVPGLDELRLRYAFGTSGLQPWPAWQRRAYAPAQHTVEGALVDVIGVSEIGNPELRPERVREHEFGVDAAGLDGRVRLDLTWNWRRTTDQLIRIDLAPGFGSVVRNVGRIDGHGFEARLTARPLDTRLLNWDVTAQHAWHTSTVIDLGGGAPVHRTDGFGYAVGYPVGARFSRPLLGYADANGDGIIGVGEVQLGASPVYAGRSLPPRVQTLGTVLGFFRQRVRLSALLERQSGFTQVDQRWVDQCERRRCRGAVDRSAPAVEQARAVTLEVAGRSLYAPTLSADFTRVREVALAVDLPDGWRRAARLRRASLSISARNLALWTEYDGIDPESEFGIPQSRVWAVRFDVGF